MLHFYNGFYTHVRINQILTCMNRRRHSLHGWFTRLLFLIIQSIENHPIPVISSHCGRLYRGCLSSTSYMFHFRFSVARRNEFIKPDTSNPVSSVVSRIAHWRGVSPSSILPLGGPHFQSYDWTSNMRGTGFVTWINVPARSTYPLSGPRE